MNKRYKKAVIKFMKVVEKEAPVIIPSGEYVFKWSLRLYGSNKHIFQMFSRFVVEGNKITGSNEGIRW